MFFSSILISTFFSFTSRLYKRIRDAEMCQLQIFSSPVEKSRCSLRLCVFPHGRTPPLDCLSPPVLWRWLSPTSPYRYSFYRRRRCVCGVLGFYIYKFLIQRNKEEMGNSRLASKCFRSHFLRTWLFRLLHTFHPPPPNYIWWKKADKIITRASNSFLDFTFHFRGIVTSCSVASSSIRPRSVFWRKRKKV